MSKKFEAIKKAVFYSEQNPDMLANILEGIISDVATTVEVIGVDSIEIPSGDTANTADYTGKIFSQFGDEMEGAVTLSLKDSVTGVSISNGTVSVGKTATAKSFTIVGTYSSKTAEKVVTLTTAE